MKSGIWAEISLAFADQALGCDIIGLHPRERSGFFFFRKGPSAHQTMQLGGCLYPKGVPFLICRKVPYRLAVALRLCTLPHGDLWSAVRGSEGHVQRGGGRQHPTQLQLCLLPAVLETQLLP